MSGTDPGFGEAVARFRSELDAAVTRARRASAEAAEESAAFRGRTGALAAQVRAGELRPGPDELTSPELRGAASGFRDANGLPVQQLPGGEELLAPPEPPAPVRRARPVPSDDEDEEDFSQQRILRQR